MTSMFAIGDKRWPGIAKLLEEAGELVQVCGKLIQVRGQNLHWQGPLIPRLEEELADVLAAVDFVLSHCQELDRERIEARRDAKRRRYEEWNAGEDLPPTFQKGDLVRITGGNPDGGFSFVVGCGGTVTSIEDYPSVNVDVHGHGAFCIPAKYLTQSNVVGLD